MATAVIIAGGTGNRMGQDIPKQFINVYDKPIIIYTLESFQKHPLIESIEVVCLDGWEEVLQAYANQFNINKLKWIVKGGISNQENIRKVSERTIKLTTKDDLNLFKPMLKNKESEWLK